MRLTRLSMIALLTGCASVPEPSTELLCPDLLACPEAVVEHCTAEQTPVALADAALCDRATSTDDRPSDYAIGTHTVTYTAAIDQLGLTRDATCSTTVTIVDEQAPDVQCEEFVTLVRSSADDPMPAPPRGTATDICDPDVTVTVTPDVLTEAVTDVITEAVDGSGNRSTCTTRVEVLDVFPVPGARLLGAELDDTDTTHFTLGWEPSTAPDVDELQLQGAVFSEGPWTSIQSVKVDDQLVTGTLRQASWYRLVSLSRGLVGGATEPVQVHAIARDAYDLRDVAVPGVPFATTLYGVVRHPADLKAGPFPLVLLMHGNHGNCRRNGTVNDYCALTADHECHVGGYSTTPNAEGMIYQAEMLAARGFIAATVSANALNCRSGYIIERSHLLHSHLSVWSSWQDGAAGPFGTKFASTLDLSKVGLVGHSRGGDAVSHVPQRLADRPIAGLDVQSIFAIAPTDYNDATVFESSYSLLLPACDGDVSSLWGSHIYERSRETVWDKSQVLMPGANHNFYSTEWAYDDGARVCNRAALVGKLPQTTMLQSALGEWMDRTLREDRPVAYQRAERPSPSSLDLWAQRPLDLRWSYVEHDALLADAFLGSLDDNEAGGTDTYTGFETVQPCAADGCRGASIARIGAVRLRWAASARPTATFGLGALDTSPYDAVSLRVTSNRDTWNAGRTEQVFDVVLTDADGESVTLDVRDLTPIPHLYSGYNQREVLQTVRIPFTVLNAENPAIDTDKLASVAVRLGTDDGAGSVTIADLTLGH